MLDKTTNKLSAIVENFVMGQKSAAAAKVRYLTRMELVQLLRNSHILYQGHFLGDSNARYDFEAFVERALSGWNE